MTKLGLLSLLAGFFIWIFSAISKFMNAKTIWAEITLSTLLGDTAQSLVEAVSNETVQTYVSILLFDLPLGGVVMGLGLFFLLISLFVKDH